MAIIATSKSEVYRVDKDISEIQAAAANGSFTPLHPEKK
jgi:hypothetical protein